MSTKIYNGWLLSEGPATVEGTFTLLKKARKEIGAVRLHALRSLFSPDEYREKWVKLDAAVREADRKRYRDPLDFSAEVAIFWARGRLLAISFWEHRGYDDAWKRATGARDYGYWNNTDEPEDVSPEEWEQRRLDWDAALPGAGVPALSGLCLKFFEVGLPFPDEFEGKA